MRYGNQFTWRISNIQKIKWSVYKKKERFTMVELMQTGVTVEFRRDEMHTWLIIGRVRRMLREAGHDQKWIDEVLDEATSADTEHLVDVLIQVVEFKIIE